MYDTKPKEKEIWMFQGRWLQAEVTEMLLGGGSRDGEERP